SYERSYDQSQNRKLPAPPAPSSKTISIPATAKRARRPSGHAYDVSDFPIVRLARPLDTSGLSPQWCFEMERLVRDGRRFVLIYPSPTGDEPFEDRTARTLWLKANRETMAKLCLSLIIVEPDAVQRADLEKVFPHLEHAFGAPQTAAETQQEAQFLAARLLVSN
ncbi:hypothetical protein, partial [Sphingomonas sp. ABOLH]|uniref:hypothetical protein n=1 Tax=Sphingomonas sp. ABOLH TaxID=1985881 RepID=UPI0019D27256